MSASSGAKYKAIVESIESAITSKHLRPGERLPTQRDVAYHLGLSVQTVSRAYAEAERRGLVTGEIGRGTFVQYSRSDQTTRYISDDKRDNVFDFSNVMPVLSEDHLEALKAAFADSSQTSSFARMLENRPTQGIAAHREAGADWLEQLGVATSTDRVIVTNGAAHGIWTVMASLLQPGDIVATECLVETGIITAAATLRVGLRGLPIDEEGILPYALVEMCEKEPVKLICVTPCYSVPTATHMSEERRQQIAEIAQRYDAFILEDGVFDPLARSGHKPIWHFAPERTYYATSFSKAVMSSLRTGYLTGPEGSSKRLASRLRATGWMANTWTAEIAARWVHNGTAMALIEWQRSKMKHRHDIMKRVLGSVPYVSPKYALHAWVTLPEPWRAQQFAEHARSQGVLVTTPEPFVVGRAAETHAVRLTLGDTHRSDDLFKRGLGEFVRLLESAPEPLATHY